MSTTQLAGSYTYGEGRTIEGQVVRFSCPSGESHMVEEFLRTHVRGMSIPITGSFSITHGSYGAYTRYDIVQHEYGGYSRGQGYIEALEIRNPPDARWGIVLYEYLSRGGSRFTEWDTVEDAKEAHAKWHAKKEDAEVHTWKGFRRWIHCGLLQPWFYAIGNEELIGDYTFPDGLQDDPVYRFGKKFLVYDKDGLPSVKTCMGTRLYHHREERGTEQRWRLIYWHDGTVWDESNTHHWWSLQRYPPPREVGANELWAVEAMQQFADILSGKKTEFEINFTDGNKFVGKIVQNKSRSKCAEGKYFAHITYKSGHPAERGWLTFVPTPEHPDVVSYITSRCAEKGRIVDRVEITSSETKKEGKKWSGAFFSPPA